MIFLYLLFSTLFLYYFYKSSVKDLFLFTIIFSFFYFLPLYFGVVFIKYNNLTVYKDISLKLYIIYFIFAFTMILLHIINKKINSKIRYIDINYNQIKKINKILLFIFLFSYLILAKYRWDYLFVDKTLFIKNDFWDKFYTILKLYLVYLLTLNYILKDYLKLFILFPFLVLTYIQNYRTYIILFIVSILIYEICLKKTRLFSIRNVIIGVLVIIFGFLGKTIVMLSRLDYTFLEGIRYLYRNNMLTESILNSEPFITQFILNDTILLNLTLSPMYILRYFCKLILIPPNSFTSIQSFYDLFIMNYPSVDYGIAYNIFSEPYAMLGLTGVFVFCIFFGLVLLKINNNIYSKNVFKSTTYICLASIYTFYNFRNNIENLILWTQILLIIYLSTIILQLILYKKIVKKKENINL